MKKQIWLAMGALVLAAAPRDAHAVAAGDLVIREFRLRGPSSSADEYIVIHNRTASDITVAASDASAGFGVASSNGTLIFTIPNGTVIPARGHFLGVNTAGFSLGVPNNAAWTTDIGDVLGLAIFDSANTATFGVSATTLDAVGVGSSASPYLEGTALASINSSGQYAWVRRAASGVVQDTNANGADFVLVATDGAVYNSVQSILGAPSPSNSANRDVLAGVAVSLIEPAAGANDAPNRVRVYTPVDRFELRRRITNNTGAALDAIRLRVVDLTTLNSPGYATPTQADLRPNTSDTVSITATSIGVTSAAGLTLLTPPAQLSGGAWNSILTVPGGPLANGASIDVNIALAISREGTETFTFTVETAGTLPVIQPVMDPVAGGYGASQSVSLSTPTVGAEIRYTTNGSTPTSGSTLYTGTAVSVGETTTLKAIGLLTNWADSPVSSATYTLSATAPAISPDGAVFQGAQSVAITTSTEAPVDLWYTLDGSTPVSSAPSLLYAGPFNVSSPLTLKASAFKTGWTTSGVSSAAFIPTVATPVFTPAPGIYATSQAVTITTATVGATIHYTTDGNPPTILSPVYSAPVNLTQTTTLKAAAFLAGWADSLAAEGAYTLKVADPVLSPASGKWYAQRNIQVTTATPGATIYYTTDGTEPTTSSSAIAPGGDLLINRALVLRVKAYKTGLEPSAEKRGSYLITGQIAGGQYHTMALKGNGEVWGWGGNYSGQVGDGGAATARTSPVLVLSGVMAIAAGTGHSVALKADGTVWTWGESTWGKLGRATPSAVPGQVDLGGASAIAIAAGSSHTLAVLSNGEVRSWGANGSGQLGRGAANFTSSSTPVTVVTATGSLGGVVAVAAGASHSLALRADGTVVAWGGNLSGALGDGTTTTRTVATAIPAISGATSISTQTSSSFAVVGASNELKAWGLNTANQLGDGTATNRLLPVLITAGVKSVGAGGSHAVFADWDARVWGFGRNAERQLGDATNLVRNLPVRSRMSRQVLALGQGANCSLAADATGVVWATGFSSNGQLGLGNFTSPFLPTAIPSFSLVDATNLALDIDNDGLNLFDEFLAGTDPLAPDTNGNGMLDGAERALGLGGAVLDSDGDGLSNDAEILAGTDAFEADTDGDGFADGVDQFPLDPSRNASSSTPGDAAPPVITVLKPFGATIIP